MAGLRWTFEELVQYLDQSSCPTDPLNPIIRQLLTICPGSHIFGIGGHSVVLWVSPNIAAKVSLYPEDRRLRHEQDIFELFRPSECPHLVESFFSGVDVTFLEMLANGTLHDRMSIDKPRPILHWMLQLSSAAACLEALGYAHGDINPQNILLDAFDQVKLIDFDHSPKVGDALDVGYEPYVRQHREVVGGVYGVAGSVTEQFALGSVFWYMTRGSELYSELEGSEQVDRLLDGNLPITDPFDPIDRIIGNCLNGRYVLVADLVKDISNLLGIDLQTQETVSSSQRCYRRRYCEKYYSLIAPLIGDGKATLEVCGD
ncbi:hypothetical protein HIM_09455 [Hirsutella minnesotensis 3608]|uniref:Protein kinase domain-containing protein n=1 Tax=Hirsutella minnesotensis 3608 TaxID=1043627 RepID=A0A0F7ZGM6_9HYPO|nr:hypothetical protein HIM_09455 [Hirsutella minnesotensis 3608]